MVFSYVAVFLFSALALAFAGNWLVRSLTRIAHYFGWQEFIAAFFLVSFAVSVPELLVGVTAALGGIPELSFGNIIGANVIHFTLALGLATLILGKMQFESHTVRMSALFTIGIALLPLLLIADGNLSQFDGGVLIASFLLYASWIFSRRQRFSRWYAGEAALQNQISPLHRFHMFLEDVGIFTGAAVLLVLAAYGIVSSASFFAELFHLPLVVVGIFIVGLGTALPETYFSIISAERGNALLVAGNLLGSTVLTASLVLGIVALIRPIIITDASPYVVARLFLIISALALLFFLRTGNTITRREAFSLLMLYIAFILVEFLLRVV